MVTDQISGPDNVSIQSYGLSNFGGITHIREKRQFFQKPFLIFENVFHDIFSVLMV